MSKKFENKKDYPTDEELIERFQNGDVYAFEQIVKRYKNQLLNFAYRFLGDIEDSEDIVQETFLRIFRKRNAYRNIAKFSTWIYTITGNLAKTELRRRKKRKLFSISSLGYDEKDYELPDHRRGPEEKADSVVKEEIIQKAIDVLSPKFKEVIILRDIQELSYEEISKILKIPLGTVKSRVNRARLKLQEILGDLFKNLES
jgi:RNA polymerase sigma-70 factor (ECF subfamily)